MSFDYSSTTAPISLRPLNRTRRRSSSLSAIYSSPELESSPQLRVDRKHSKRSRVTRNPPSPLKHSQHAVVPTTIHRAGNSEFTPLALTSNSPFSCSAFDFSLPSTSSKSFSTPPTALPRIPRTRTTSSPSHSSVSPPSTTPYESTTFVDLSFSSSHSHSPFSSSSSSPPSPPSAATSPPSPPNFGFLLSTARKLPLSEPEPEASFEISEDDESEVLGDEHSMKCDEDQGEGETELKEAERLYHVAFEQLRRTTREDEESFVDRMRRWEESEHQQSKEDERIPETAREEEEEDLQEADDEEDQDDLEFKVDVDIDLDIELLGGTKQKQEARVTEFELDELTRRMKSGACELEDYGLVRQAQASARRRTQVAR
ncbi:uncharacterized protein JCM6883_007056 [Sporobolomyces salmoneus]|uniref:uncharacterized protein n=1 Tax=Sporobolomyces salmoneus TaxID=183962 RepID=UPI00317144F4